jgi:hypothetical protein
MRAPPFSREYLSEVSAETFNATSRSHERLLVSRVVLAEADHALEVLRTKPMDWRR